MTRFTIQPVQTDFAAEIFDLDLSKKLSSGDIDFLKEVFWKYAVLIFPEQKESYEYEHFWNWFQPPMGKYKRFFWKRKKYQ